MPVDWGEHTHVKLFHIAFMIHVALLLHGFSAQKSEGVAQCRPAKKPEHWQAYEFIRSIHCPLLHGELTHSLMFVWQRGPVKPGRQVQTNVESLVLELGDGWMSVQSKVPDCWHQSWIRLKLTHAFLNRKFFRV